MKKVLLSVLLLFVGFVGFGQCPPDTSLTFTSQAEIDAFGAQYPNCTTVLNLFIGGADIMDLTPLSGIEFIEETLNLTDNAILENLNGLNNLYVGGILEIRNNSVLTSLQGLDGITTNSTIEFTDLIFIIDNPSLQSLEGLETFSGNFVKIYISGNNALVNLDGLQGVTSVSLELGIGNNDQLTSLDGIENITDISDLAISNNNVLEDISAIQNLQNLGLFGIVDNPILSVCSYPNICSFIVSNPNDANIWGNAPGCESVAEVLANCQRVFQLTGELLFDLNDDGCDIMDFSGTNILITITGDNGHHTRITDSLGRYFFSTEDEGQYIVSIVPESLPSYYDVAPPSQTIIFDATTSEIVADFCITTTETINDLSIEVLPINVARPGFGSYYSLLVENKGTTTLSGTATLNFDDARQEFVESTPVPSSTNINLLEFNFNNLLPFEQRSIIVRMLNFVPPTNNSGDILNFVAEITPITGDSTPENNNYVLDQVMVNSFDPNDKLVAQGEEIFEVEVGDFLDYTVRFQNTGTADAINVRIEDELSTNLNWNTFRMLSSSHEYRLEITDGNQVAFILDNINLPPEVQDPEGSNGYVAFQIRTNNDLVLGDSVENTASIFFDFNAPIITNTITTTVVEEPDAFPIAVCQDIQVILDATGNAMVDATIVGANSTDDNGITNYEVVPNTFDCSQIGFNEVLLTVTDTAGNQSTCTAMIEVVDITAPIIMCSGDLMENIPAGDMYEIPNYVTNGNVTATDNCTAPLTIITQSPASGTMVAGGTYPIEITYEDEAGNLDGCTFMLTVTEILGITNAMYLNEIMVYPNPVSQKVTISISKILAYNSASIYSIVGKKLMETDKKVIDVSSLQSGVYFITIETTQGTITKKIVKE